MNIGIFGATGSFDFGDYAMMIHNIQQLYTLNQTHSFTIFSINKSVTQETLSQNIQDTKLLKKIRIVDDNLFEEAGIDNSFFSKLVRGLNYRILKRDIIEKRYLKFYDNLKPVNHKSEFSKALAAVDLCLFNGGGYLQHSWKYHNIRFMIEIRLAKMMQIPVVFLANSVGPMKLYDRFTRETLPLVDSIMVRDGREFSWKVLDDYGVLQKLNGPDDLFNACDLYCLESTDSDDFVIIEIMAWIQRAPKGEKYIISVLAGFIDYLTIEENKKIRLINFDKWDIVAKESIRELFSIVKHPEMMEAMYEIESMYQVFEWFKQCSFSLSFKYHPVILALGAGKPCAAVIADNDGYYLSKLKGAFMNCNMNAEEHVIHISELTISSAKELYLKTKESICSSKTKDNLHQIRNDYLISISNGAFIRS